MEKHLELMNNPVEMKDLFFAYLKSRIHHCRMSLLDACERDCEIKSAPDGLFWEDGHFGLYAYRCMIYMCRECVDCDWKYIQEDATYSMCLNQVVKEINRINGSHDHFLAFFEELQLRTVDRINK